MAITAKFEADFSAFNDSVNQAVSLLGGLATALPAAAVVHEITALVQSSIELGSSIAKMSEQMGIATEDVQRLSYLAGQTGVSMGTLTSATQSVTVAVGDHSKGLVKAARDLGLSWDDLAAADPYQRMVLLATAIGQIEDPVKRATAAHDAFGAKWKEIMPAVLADMETIGAEAPVMSDATVQALNEIDAALARASAHAKVWAGETIIAIEKVAAAAGKGFSSAQGQDGKTDVSAIIGDALTPADMAAGIKAPPKPAGAEPLAIAGMKGLELAASDLKLILIDLNRETDKSIIANKAAAAAQKAHAAAIKEAAQAMEKEQNRAIVIMEGKVAEITKAWGQYATAVAAASHDTTQKQIDDVQRNADAQMAAMDRAKTGSVSAYQAIQMAADQLAANIKQHTIEEDSTTLAHYQLVADQAQAAYAFALANGDQYTDERIADLQREAEAATTALQNWSRNAVTEVEKIKKPADEAAAAIKGMHDQILELKGVGTKLPGSTEETDSMGNRYLISPTGQRVPMGPHGEMPGNWWEMYTGQGSTPEAFNPLLLQGRRNVGTLAGANAVQMNAGAVTINYPVMNDPAAMDKLAGVVGDAIMSRITRTGKVV